ncbi:hypothetical protein Ancab_010519 [Ancistrocladus abbreviatus]
MFFVAYELLSLTNWQLAFNRDDDEGFAIMSRHCYPIETHRVFKRTRLQKLKEALISLKDPGENETALVNGEGTTIADVPRPKPGGKMNNKSSDVNKTTNDGGCTKQATLKTVTGGDLGLWPPTL